MTDGKDVGVDLTGGFHDAGDHVKFGLPEAYAASTLGWSYYEFKDEFAKSGQDKYMLNILKHFTDYFLKSYVNKTTFYYQCGDGTLDHSYWGPPELQTTDRPTLFAATPETPASDVCGNTAAALALMSMNYKSVDPVYAAKCLTAAEDLFSFGDKYRGLSKSGGFYGATSYYDDLCWGAIWLYLATNDNTYLTKVDSLLAEKGITGDNSYANHWTHCWDDVFGGVFIKLAQITSNAKYKAIAEENLDYWMNGVQTTAGGLKYINSWGALRYTAAECLMSVVYYKTSKQQKYLDFAKGQINYMLGTNPEKMSYEVGFGTNYPKFPHHRAASGRMESAPAYEKKTQPEKHLLYGALVGGPSDDDTYIDDVDEYEHSEVAIDYNAGFVGALAGVSNYYGADQKPLPTPGIEPTTSPLYVEANVMKEDTQGITIQAFIHNDASLPPHYEKGLSFRYFVDLTEYYEHGGSVDDLTAAINYGPNGGQISKLIPWDKEKHIYYIEASWPTSEIYGKLEFQFVIAGYNLKCFDSTNDFSRKDLNSLTNTISSYIPVYRNGIKVFGSEPSNSNVIVGDLNGDHKVNVLDYLKLKKYLAKPSGTVDTNAWDINKDGIIDNSDYTALRKLLLSKK